MIKERLAAALGEASLRHSKTMRRDVLLMEMVSARYSGVAFTEREFEDYLVELYHRLSRGVGIRCK